MIPSSPKSGERYIAKAIRTFGDTEMKTKKKRRADVHPMSSIPLPLMRTTLLKNAKVTHEQLADMVVERFGGARLSRATVGAVLGGVFRNENVIDVFCEITNTDPDEMFPQEDP